MRGYWSHYCLCGLELYQYYPVECCFSIFYRCVLLVNVFVLFMFLLFEAFAVDLKRVGLYKRLVVTQLNLIAIQTFG